MATSKQQKAFKMTKSEIFKLAHRLARAVINDGLVKGYGYQKVFANQLKRIYSVVAKREQRADEIATIVKYLNEIGFDGDVDAYIHGLFLSGNLAPHKDVVDEVLLDIEGALVYVNKDVQSFCLKRALFNKDWLWFFPDLRKYQFNKQPYEGRLLP